MNLHEKEDPFLFFNLLLFFFFGFSIIFTLMGSNFILKIAIPGQKVGLFWFNFEFNGLVFVFSTLLVCFIHLSIYLLVLLKNFGFGAQDN